MNRTIRHRCRLCKREIGPDEQRCVAVSLTGADLFTHYKCEVAAAEQRKGVA